jgi:ABC-type glycerol-3-phosphate transport system substrate-binding protein
LTFSLIYADWSGDGVASLYAAAPAPNAAKALVKFLTAPEATIIEGSEVDGLQALYDSVFFVRGQRACCWPAVMSRCLSTPVTAVA